MKYLFSILLFFMLVSCQKDYHLGDEAEEIPTQQKPTPSRQSYIYDERIANLTYPYCHIIGTIDGHEVNRQCDVKKGFIHIGSSNQYQEGEYKVALTLIRHQQVILHILDTKQIYIE